MIKYLLGAEDNFSWKRNAIHAKFGNDREDIQVQYKLSFDRQRQKNWNVMFFYSSKVVHEF